MLFLLIISYLRRSEAFPRMLLPYRIQVSGLLPLAWGNNPSAGAPICHGYEMFCLNARKLGSFLATFECWEHL